MQKQTLTTFDLPQMKTFLPIIASVLFLSSCAIFNHKNNSTTGNPAYYQQWFEEHKNERGEIPEGLTESWYLHDRELIQNDRGSGESPIATLTNLSVESQHGGRTRAIMVSSLDSNLIFAGSVTGGLWRSIDGGQNWAAINDQSAGQKVSSIAENPFNPREIYYGTGEEWNSFPGNGIYKSTDGGLTFEKLPSSSLSEMTYCNMIVHSTIDSSTLWVGTTRGLFQSTDSGSSWKKIPVSSLTASFISGIIHFPDSSMLVSVKGRTLYRTAKAGTEPFVEIKDSTFPKTTVGRIMIANCAIAAPTTVYALFCNNTSNAEAFYGIFRSDDGGLSWKKTTDSQVQIGTSYQSYCIMLGVHPRNPNFLIIGALSTRFSRNGGVNWTSFNSGHSDNHVYCHAGRGNTNDFFIGNDGGIYKGNFLTLTTGTQVMNKGYTCAQYYAGDYGSTGANCIGGTQDNGTWLYTNGSAEKFYGGDGTYAHIGHQSPSLLYCGTQNGKIYKKEGIANLSDISPATAIAEGVNFVNQNEINYTDDAQIYYRTNKGIWRTLDRGLTWDKINKTTISNISALAVSKSKDPTVYLAGSGTFYRIENAATIAKESPLKNLSSLLPSTMRSNAFGTISFHPENENTLLVGLTTVSTQPRAWRGEFVNTDTMKWRSISGNLPKNLSVNQVQAHPDDPDRIYLAATDFGLYYTLDGGLNWQKETRMPNVGIDEMKLRSSDKSLFLFTHGRSVWHLRLKDLSTVKTSEQRIPLACSVFPNPSSDWIYINSEAEIGNIQVFDSQGRELTLPAKENGIDLSPLTAGPYFVRIYDKNGNYTVKKIAKSN